MSAILILPIVLPAAPLLLPVLVAAGAAAASAMGFAAAKTRGHAEGVTEVELTIENSEAVTGEAAVGQETVWVKGDVQLVFGRDSRGKACVRVIGRGHTEDELRAIGRQFAESLVQQYVYHRLMTELKERNLNVVDEAVEEDGTVRLHVRTYQA